MKRPSGFTLVELVVVVMILGILAAIALPKILTASRLAEQKSLEYSTKIVQDAIDYYATANRSELPGSGGTEEALKADLKPYLRNFPENPLLRSGTVKVHTDGKPLEPIGGKFGWLYDNQSGEFIANSDPSSPPSNKTK